MSKKKKKKKKQDMNSWGKKRVLAKDTTYGSRKGAQKVK